MKTFFFMVTITLAITGTILLLFSTGIIGITLGGIFLLAFLLCTINWYLIEIIYQLKKTTIETRITAQWYLLSNILTEIKNLNENILILREKK